MAEYLALRITEGAIGYAKAVSAYPQFKTLIDEILIKNGKGHLIV